MADVTGGTPPTNASPFAVPDDITAVYDHFGAPEWFSVATAASLPASGNWVGRALHTADTNAQYVCTGLPGTWVRTFEDTGWQTPTFSGSGWANFGSPYETAQYRRLNGEVIVKGFVKGGTNTTLFTLPVGFRPGELLVRTVGSGTGLAIVNILTNGGFQVTAYASGGSNVNVQIACRFVAEG